jgi:hypothetical protein
VAVLAAAPERDSQRREGSARDVVVDGGEDPRLERLAAEGRKLVAGRGVELPLMLVRGPHEAER